MNAQVETAAPEVRHTPKVGDTVLVRHRVKANKRGEATLEPCKGVVGKINTVYLDGDVKVGDDLWAIKKSGDSKTDWWTHAETQREVRA
jgi:hypothetical protein